MNYIKKVLALTVVLAITVLSFCGCHKKGEVAVKIGDVKFTTGKYLFAVYQNAASAISTIQSENSDLDTEKKGYYRNQKVDGKVFADYVSEKSLEMLKDVVAVELYMDKYDIKLTSEEEENFKSNAEAYWNYMFTYNDDPNYSLGKFYEENGVSQKTFIELYKRIQLSEYVFDKVYGKDGKKAVSDEEIQKYFKENYFVINSVSTDSEYSSKTDDEKKTIKNTYDDWAKKINDGQKTFDEAYAELSGSTSTDGEAAKPQDSYINEDSDDYKTVKGMKTGEAKVVKLDDDAGYKLVYKKDIEADSEGATQYDETIRHALKSDEFEKELDSLLKDKKVTKDKTALKVVKINKMDFDTFIEVQSAMSSAIYQAQQQASSQS